MAYNRGNKQKKRCSVIRKITDSSWSSTHCCSMPFCLLRQRNHPLTNKQTKKYTGYIAVTDHSANHNNNDTKFKVATLPGHRERRRRKWSALYTLRSGGPKIIMNWSVKCQSENLEVHLAKTGMDRKSSWCCCRKHHHRPENNSNRNLVL